MAKGRGWMYLYRKHLFSERAETVISLRVDSPRVMPQRGVLVQRVRFRVILATAFNSVDYSQKSIEIP